MDVSLKVKDALQILNHARHIWGVEKPVRNSQEMEDDVGIL